MLRACHLSYRLGLPESGRVEERGDASDSGNLSHRSDGLVARDNLVWEGLNGWRGGQGTAHGGAEEGSDLALLSVCQ